MTNNTKKDQKLVQVFDGEIGGIQQPVVDGRTLHAVLGVNRDFTTWIKKRISDYKFQESIDYLLTKSGEQLPSGTKYSTEYSISLDMAKELAMVERTEMGRAVRKYFIECERNLLMNQCANNQLANQDKEDKEDREIGFLYELAKSRTLYWAIKKRDLIFRPGMDEDVLFSILEDIQFSLYEEYYRDCRRKFPLEYSSQYFKEMKAHARNWTPRFYRENTNPKIE